MGCYRVSQRLAARFCRSSLRYESCRDPLTALRQRLRELAQTRVRFGYRRLLVLMHREGWAVGKHRLYRLYTEEGLALRRKRSWRHATAVHRERRQCEAGVFDPAVFGYAIKGPHGANAGIRSALDVRRPAAPRKATAPGATHSEGWMRRCGPRSWLPQCWS